MAAAETEAVDMGAHARSARQVALTTIGEVAEEFGFTARALRLYEEKGLISPIRIGNRRAYSDQDRRRLAIIAQGKRAGLALDEIGEILRAEDSLQPNRYLDVALQTYRARMEAIDAQQAELGEMLRQARLLIAELEAQQTSAVQ